MITGGAHGIGLELARGLGERGLKIVLADYERDALDKAVADLSAEQITVRSVLTDVSQAREVVDLADVTLNEFGHVHLVFNNAGVFCKPRLIWEHPDSTWMSSFNVNLHGVLNGIRAFIPRMLEQDHPGHMVNIASVAGHIVQPYLAPYQAAKFAVTALTETLFLDLQTLDCQVNASLVSPGFTQTNILETMSKTDEAIVSDLSRLTSEIASNSMLEGVRSGQTARQVADTIIAGIEDDLFYIMTHPYALDFMKQRFEGILTGKNPDLSDELKSRFVSTTP